MILICLDWIGLDRIGSLRLKGCYALRVATL